MKRLELDFNVFYRYFERGIFFNKSFAELPQNSNLEQFGKLMLIIGDRSVNRNKTTLSQNNIYQQQQIALRNTNSIDSDYLNSNNNSNNNINNNMANSQNNLNNQNSSNFGQDNFINDKINDRTNLVYGIGIRYFKLEQNNLQQISSNFNIPNFIQTSIAPETAITYFFDEINSITLSGWYEFRYIRNDVQQIPNLVLFTNIFL